MVRSLRISESKRSLGLSVELEALQRSLASAEEKATMQLSQVRHPLSLSLIDVAQINTLLLDHVSLQSDGIEQRDKLLERECVVLPLAAGMD